jgi:DNA-binding winged helix-turn-helix (wHTH) protein
MGVLEAEEYLEFDGFRLDRRTGTLSRLNDPDRATPVAIGSRALDILQLLIDHQGDLVPKQSIMERVWPDTVVEESNLTTQIAALRRLLDLNREGKSCIQTIPGRGYRFVPTVRRMPAKARRRVWRLFRPARCRNTPRLRDQRTRAAPRQDISALPHSSVSQPSCS